MGDDARSFDWQWLGRIKDVRLVAVDDEEETMSKVPDRLREIADRADMTYATRSMLRTLADRISEEYVELPRDANGTPWHIGDRFKLDDCLVAAGTVGTIMYDRRGCYVNYSKPTDFERYEPPTVASIADELEEAVGDNECDGVTMVPTSKLNEWAKALRRSDDDGD